ncbi:MAG: type II secretion system F family protein [Actinomycetota bacterium]|nr:type II secretion system F family protein [Actinomycetota bacterium]
MAVFEFRAVDLAGVPSRGDVEATSKTAVSEQLRQRGLIVLDVSERREAFKLESIFQRFKNVKARPLAIFSRQFATLISSGMPMLRSLYTLEDQTDDEMLKRSIVAVRQDVEAGSSVAQAMESQPGVFDPLYRSMVEAGEGSGRLEEALDRVANQLERLDALRRQVRSAMMYPMGVFVIALLVMSAVCAFVVPVFTSIFVEIAEETPGAPTQLPLPTRITVAISDFITGKWYILILMIAGIIYVFNRWKSTDRGRMQWDKTKLRFPAHIGDIVHKVALARWSRTFAGTISSGVPMLQAIKIAGQTAGNAVVEDAMDDVYNSVKSGGSIAKPLQENDAFPAMVSHMVAVGEDSGQLETMLEKVADFYETEVDAKVKALTSLIEPLMICLIGGGVGFIVISMYLPIFSLYDNIR